MLPIDECTFIGDKAYDEKHVYSTVRELYHGDAVIPLNRRNTKDPAKLPSGNPIVALAVAYAAVLNNARHSSRAAKALRRAG